MALDLIKIGSYFFDSFSKPANTLIHTRNEREFVMDVIQSRRRALCNPVILGLALLLCSFCRAESPPPIIASTLHYPPYEYLENGVAKGIAVDIIREALKRSGRPEVFFKFYPWKRAVYHTQHGDGDLLFNAGKNQQRQEWGYYVNSVLIQQSYVLFKLRNDHFSVLPDFSNTQDKVISIRQGYLYGSGPFRKALDSGRFLSVALADSTEQSVKQLLNGRVDMFVGDQLPVLYYLKQNGMDRYVDIVLYQGEKLEVLSWPTYLLFSKSRTTPEFIQKVYIAMEEMKRDGSFQRIIRDYSGEK